MNNERKMRWIADIVLLTVAFLWGTTFVASKAVLQYFTPLWIIAIRFCMATFFMGLIFHKKIKTINREDIKAGGIVGVVLFIAFVTQLIGLQYTTAGKQAFLAGTYVVMVPFLFWMIYKKRPDGRAFIGAFVCFVGIGFLTLNETFSMGFGDGITLFSSVFFALHIMVNGYYAQKRDVVILSMLQFGVLAILSFVGAMIFEPFPQSASPEGWAGILYLGILCSAVAYFLQTVAQKYTLSTHTSLLLSLESVFGSLLAVAILGEQFTLKMVAGCVAIFGAILISELRPAEKKESDGVVS